MGLCPVLVACLGLLQIPPPFGIVLPEGPVAARLAELDPSTVPAKLGASWPDWADHGASAWGAPPPWRRWVELLRAEARSGEPARRAELAELARLQGRDADAWSHWLEAARDPAQGVALLPLFLPGALEVRGPDSLPEGALLCPSLPPCSRVDAGLREMAGTAIELGAFSIGAARASLKVAVSGDGLEVVLQHLAGAPARVRVKAPVPPGIDPGKVLADWERQPDGQEIVEFVLDAENAEHSLWLTFHPRAERWPRPPVELLRPLASGRTLLVLGRADDAARLRSFAEAAHELLGISTRFVTELPATSFAFEPLVLDLRSATSLERKLGEMLGRIEALVLPPASR
jgi:hypothetical protein